MRFIHLIQQKKQLALSLTFALLLPVMMLAQRSGMRDVTGKVTDNSGSPLPGVTVKVKGASTVAASNTEGVFSIKAKDGDVLVFSSVSFNTKAVVVAAGTSKINVELEASSAALNDVVVVGYGKGSRKSLSSAITSIKPDELNRGAISDVGQLMQGKVAGLNISASGDPNKPAAVILRGASTINSPSGPFYVIDGVPGGDIATVAPDDIASMDILKDAAATAIYGNRAANGVIMITTKKGKKGSMQTNYNGYVGVENVTNRLKVMDAPQLKAYLTANGVSASPNDDFGANTDWMKAIQRPSSLSQNHNIAISGGSEKSTYSASINYLDKQGILNYSSLKRIIARLSVEQYALNNRVKFGLNVANSYNDASYTPLQNIVLLQAAKHMPISPVLNADGSYFENLSTTGYFNPVAMMDHAQDKTKYSALLAGFTTEVKLPFDLTYNLNLSYQTNQSLHGEYYDSYFGKYPSSNFYNNPDPGIGIAHTLIGSLFGTNGSALRNTYQNRFSTLETFLTWNKKIKEHSINAVVGYSWQDNISGDGFQASSTNFVSDYTGYMNLGLGNPYALPSYRIQFGNDNYSQTKMISDFFRLNYNYKEKYLLQASVRRDGSSVFGKNNQWGYFPSVGLAWRISQEDFMSKQNIFSDLKLRASFGETGNALGFGAYTSQLVFGSTGTYYDNGVFATAIGAIQGSNPDLQWEKTSTKNIGLEFTILNGKVSGTLDLYNKNTTGMIFNYNVSSSLVPGGRIFANGGSMNNKGIELSLNATPVKTNNFSWNTALNLASNKNEVTSLYSPYGNTDSTVFYSDPEGPGQTNATLQLLKVGKPLGQFFSLQYMGKDANGMSTFLKRDGTTSLAPAMRTDYFYLGSPQPKLLMGWSNNFKYKHWDLNVFIRGVFGNKIFNATRADLFYVYAAAVNNIAADAAGDKLTDSKNSAYSSRFVENGSYIRFDNATLAYNFKLNSKYVQGLRLYTTVNNLLVITKYNGIDPEVNQGGVSPGIDFHNFYPKTRTVMLGLNLTF